MKNLKILLVSMLITTVLWNFAGATEITATNQKPTTALSNSEKLNRLLNNLSTFKADFIQIITTESGEVLEQLSGHFVLKKPGKFSWQVSQPFQQVLIADGQYLWQYDEDLEQAMVRDLDDSLSGTPAQLLSGTSSHLETTYNIIYSKDISETFFLTPVDESQFETIELTFLKGALEHLKLEDTMGQVTTVQFTDAKYGIAVADSLFQLKLADDVELVDSRKYNDNFDSE